MSATETKAEISDYGSVRHRLIYLLVYTTDLYTTDLYTGMLRYIMWGHIFYVAIQVQVDRSTPSLSRVHLYGKYSRVHK